MWKVKKEDDKTNLPFWVKMPKGAILFCKEKGIELAENEKSIGVSLNEDRVVHAFRLAKQQRGQAFTKEEFLLFKEATKKRESIL